MSGKHEAPPAHPGALGRALRGLYRLAVVLSALIVLGWAAFRLFLRPPQIPQPPAVDPAAVDPAVSAASSGPDGPDASEAEAPSGPVRRDQVYTFLLVGVDKGNGNADTIMAACYDVPARRVGVVSIPRDTIVDRTWTRYPKINGAYGKGGAELVRQEVSRLLGVPLDFCIQVDLRGFVNLVDAVGGVDFDVPVDMNYDDPWQDLSIHFRKGMQHLNGKQAMEVVRFRHNNDNTGYSDTGRTRTQQALLTAVAKKVLSWNSVPRITEFFDIVRRNAQTDLTAQDLAWFASQALYLDPASGVECATLSGRGDARYNGYSWCFELDADKALDDVNRLLNPYDRPVTRDMMHVVRAHSYET